VEDVNDFKTYLEKTFSIQEFTATHYFITSDLKTKCAFLLTTQT